MKEAYYFSHDSNASTDDKILELRAAHGWAGYGLYWALIERLRDSDGYKLPVKRIKALAVYFGVDPEIMQSIIYDFDLFSVDDDYFFSDSLLNRMSLRDSKIEQARTAGQRSGEVRRNKTNDRSTDVQQTFNDRSTDDEQGKEIKGKENINTHTIGDAEFFEIQNSIQKFNPEITVPEAIIETRRLIAFFSERGWTYSNGRPVESLAAAAANWTIKKPKNNNTNGSKQRIGFTEAAAKW